jgi:hypothetical protein
MQDSNELKGKEAYEARKAEKVAQKQSVAVVDSDVKNRKNYAGFMIIALVTAGLSWWIISSILRSAPQTEDKSMSVPDQGNTHISVGEAHAAYNSNPPTSGPHYEQPARPGFREEPIADEHLIHSLEHGLVWISYRPSLSEEAVDQLRDFARDSMVVITSRETNDSDVAIAAWTRLDKFDIQGSTLSEEEEQRIQDFITRYRNRGPEKLPPGSHGGV